MKLVTFKSPSGETAPGVMSDDLKTVISLAPTFSDMLVLLDAGDAGLALAAQIKRAAAVTYSRAEVTLLSPLPIPRRLRDCTVFEEHILGGAKFFEKIGRPEFAKVPEVWYKNPIYYKCNHLSVCGPDADIVWPVTGQRLDYELEIAAVIGKRGKNIAAEHALDHLFGFTIYNDFSVRDASAEMMGLLGPAKAKDFDGGNAIGPWIVTKDEFPDFYALNMQVALNGEVIGGGNTSQMYHRWDKIISYLSLGETIYPGEIVGSGTVGGGTLVEKGRFLSEGDVVELSIDGIGILRNKLVRD